ncbi:hypothetical protein AB0I54_46630 [Streptomyces sp. NPDC050625]|uniref:hypothetical protein n=1 Tax=Streptomyces sp. NPDC050625 TaxID=3154629 RepID=UPI0034396115
MFFNVLAAFAEFEVDLLKMRTRELLKMRTREGMTVARSWASSRPAGPSSRHVSRPSWCACTAPASTPSLS